MSRSERQSRIRMLADQYMYVTGESAYAGREQGARHYFFDGLVIGDEVALQHMINLCQQAGVPTE